MLLAGASFFLFHSWFAIQFDGLICRLICRLNFDREATAKLVLRAHASKILQ